MTSAWLALLLASTTGAIGVPEVPNPRAHGGWVTDAARLLGAGGQGRLDRRLSALERDLGVEIAVVTVPDVDGTPAEFATALFRHWGIGKRGLDNGLLVLVVQRRRRIEMRTGYGLEQVLPDSWLAHMQAAEMVPRFRARDFAGGIEAGLTAIDERLRAHPEPAPPLPPPEPAPIAATGWTAPPPPAPPATEDRTFLGIDIPIALTLFALGSGGVLVWRWGHRRRRTCRACGARMQRLLSDAENWHLDHGDQVERQLRSVRHEVWRCGRCARVRHLRSVRWFSGVSSCGRCRRRTAVVNRTTMRYAAVGIGGLIRHESRCHSCGESDVRYEDTAPLPVVATTDGSSSFSSSSDGGGSSFGGGDTGGGGAGSDY
jgi:uncharacterized protein